MAGRAIACSMVEKSVYETAYAGARNLMAACCPVELYDSLQKLTPTARDEAAWGVVDALADLVRGAAIGRRF